MNTDKIFIDNVRHFYHDMGSGVFLKLKNGKYVQIDNIENLWNLFKVNHKMSSTITLSTSKNETFYIEESSLIPYYEKRKHKILRKIKSHSLCDSRNPVGRNL